MDRKENLAEGLSEGMVGDFGCYPRFFGHGGSYFGEAVHGSIPYPLDILATHGVPLGCQVERGVVVAHNLWSMGAVNLVKANGASVPPPTYCENSGGKGPGPPPPPLSLFPFLVFLSRSLNSKNSLPWESTFSFMSPHLSCLDLWDPLKPKPTVRKKNQGILRTFHVKYTPAFPN